jgi:hypothetical protein
MPLLENTSCAFLISMLYSRKSILNRSLFMKKQQLSKPDLVRQAPKIGGGGGGVKPVLVIAGLLCAFVMSSCDDGSTESNVNLAGTTWIDELASETFMFGASTYDFYKNGDKMTSDKYTVSGNNVTLFKSGEPWQKQCTVNGNQLTFGTGIFIKQ